MQLMTSSFVTNIAFLDNADNTVCVKLIGSELERIYSSASGERNIFLLATKLRISDFIDVKEWIKQYKCFDDNIEWTVKLTQDG